MIGVGARVGRARAGAAPPPAFHPADLPETIVCADPQTLALDNTAGNLCAQWRLGDPARFGNRTIYEATQAISSKRPLVATDSSGILHTVYDVGDDIMDINFPAFGTAARWVAVGFYQTGNSRISSSPITLGDSSGTVPAGTVQLFAASTVEVTVRPSGAIAEADFTITSNVKTVLAYSHPENAFTSDVQIYDGDGNPATMTYPVGPNVALDTRAGGSVNSPISSARFEGRVYVFIVASPVPTPANQIKILDYMAAQMGIA